MFTLGPHPIEREQLISKLQNHKSGALVVFEGWVRDHNEGKKVASLEYQVYEELALKEGNRILQECKERFNLHHILCVHRYGHLKLGESAVWIGVTAAHRDDAYKASRFVIDQIKLRLPIWKKEHYLEQEAQWVFCKDHHTHVHFHENDYYKKQSKLIDQVTLKESNVLVVGAGGLGCPVLTSLATAGVGHIDFVDFDKVSLSNIHRQPLYSPEAVGEYKVSVAQSKLKALNPFIHIHGHNDRIDALNVERFLKGKDLILDCTDNLQTKFLLHDASFRLKIPLISASIYQYEGQIRTFIPGESGCLRCLFEKTPEDAQLGNCNDFGVLGSAVTTIGGVQANEAILYLLHKKNNTTQETFYFNLKDLTMMKVKHLKKAHCETCQGLRAPEIIDYEISLKSFGADDYHLVDIRESELVIENYLTSSKPVILYCHRGIKSKSVVMNLRLQGYQQFYSLQGGVCSL